jgi:predicted transposase/invertase (TIGR01784 family)
MSFRYVFISRRKDEGTQAGRLEAKLEAIPKLLELGLTVEQVAEALGLICDRSKSRHILWVSKI